MENNCSVELTTSFDLQCIGSNIGGVQAIGIAKFEKGAVTKPNNNTLSAMPEAITTIYRYELKNPSNIATETNQTNAENRSELFVQSSTAILSTLDTRMRNEVKNLTKSEVFLFVESNDSNHILLLGSSNGCTASYSVTTGGAIADGANITITFTANEMWSMLSLDPTAISAYKNLIFDGSQNR